MLDDQEEEEVERGEEEKKSSGHVGQPGFILPGSGDNIDGAF